jgi:hypothetical protein
VWESRLNGSWSEVKSVIDWTEFDRPIIECALKYLYTGDYDPDRTVTESLPCTQQEEEPCPRQEEKPFTNQEEVMSKPEEEISDQRKSFRH